MVTSKKRVLLVGDLIVDVHHYGTHVGTSREAVIPVGVQERETLSWGGAGLVVRNLLALRTPVTFFSVVGDDRMGKEISRYTHPLLVKRLHTERGRATIVKERFLLDGQKVLRWNRGSSTSIAPVTERKVLSGVKVALAHAKVLLISDYRHGVISERLARELVAAAHKKNVPVYVDSQVTRIRPNHGWYRGADCVVVNETEAKTLLSTFSTTHLTESLKRLKKLLGVSGIIAKLGKDGSAALIGDDYQRTPSRRVKEVDATGAGDAFFAALGSTGTLTPASLRKANDWAGLAVTVSGTEPPRFSAHKNPRS